MAAAVWGRSGLADPPPAPSTPRLIEPGPPEGLYVHFPFCVSLCPYCDFVVVAGSAARGPRNRIEALLDALHTELDLRADAIATTWGSARPPLASVYLGGGTPSLLAPAQIEALLRDVDDRLGIASDAEITLEANPGPDEVGDLVGFASAGVGRLSLGAQSMQAAELRRLGRRHRPDDVAAAVAAARDAGIGSISIDLLTDVPGQDLASWRATLTSVLELAPDHLSVYTLTLDDPDAEGLTGPDGDHLPVSRGARAWRERAAAEQSEDAAADMERLTDELASAAGLRRYEIANLARPGEESRHNRLYWRRRPYLALGPGAHASDGGLTRSWNAARLDAYTAALAERRLPPGGAETLDQATAVAELAILGLRLREGIQAGLAARPELIGGLAWARAHGLLHEDGGRVRLTDGGRLVANEVFARLLPGPAAASSDVGV
jgi:oxygen-independent coproporphyrinogen-3 oxidase